MPKHYRLKAETGYIGSKFEKDEAQKIRPKKSFTWQLKVQSDPLFNFEVRIPGFTKFGLKKITIKDQHGNEHWAGRGMTMFGITRWQLPKGRHLATGQKYTLIIEKWSLK